MPNHHLKISEMQILVIIRNWEVVDDLIGGLGDDDLLRGLLDDLGILVSLHDLHGEIELIIKIDSRGDHGKGLSSGSE